MSIAMNTQVMINDKTVAPSTTGLQPDLLVITDNDNSWFLPTTSPVLSCASAQEVFNTFGGTSKEYELAKVYFKGASDQQRTPERLLFGKGQFRSQGGFLLCGATPYKVADFKAITAGELTVSWTDSTNTLNITDLTALDLSTANSLSDVATLLSTALQTEGAECYCTYISNTFQFAFRNNNAIDGSYVDILVSTNGLADLLMGTVETGAKISYGYTAKTGQDVMNNITNYYKNFYSFTYVDILPQSTVIELGQWNFDNGVDYLFLPYTNNTNAQVKGDTTQIAYKLKERLIEHFAPCFGDYKVPALLGAIASGRDFTQQGSATTYKFKTQSGLGVFCDNTEAYDNLVANGYNSYGQFGSKTDNTNWTFEGSCVGEFPFIDLHLAQIWIKESIRTALVKVFTDYPKVDYTDTGLSIFQGAIENAVKKAVFNGFIQVGGDIDEETASLINSQAGREIAPIVATVGYYIQVEAPTPSRQTQRQSPICKVWYKASQAVHKIELDLIQLQ